MTNPGGISVTDPIIEATRRVIDDIFDTLRTVVDGLPAEALNWIPAGEEDTNSIAVQITHGLHATRRLLNFATEQPQQAPRDREAEFGASVDGPESLLRLIDEVAADCTFTLDNAAVADWGEMRRLRSSGEELSAAFLIIHAAEHLRGHADEASLTRHMWMAQT
jgi:hypothetical protein